MSSWWGPSPFDELIDKATSELIPANQVDLAAQFAICDEIRSKKVNPREAMRAIKRRLEHKNPNVQLATLSLLDACVKNGGNPFVREVASREFMEALTSCLHSPTGCHLEVKKKILDNIQVWALAAGNDPSLSYLTDTYSLLRAEGFAFPPVTDEPNPILLETAAPPEWTDSPVCERCRTAFTMTNRKHHCRNCGGTFCQECSSKTLPLPHLAIDESVRVCYGCYVKLKIAKVSQKASFPPPHPFPSSSNAPKPAASYGSTSSHTRQSQPPIEMDKSQNEDKQFEEDLKKALELSQKEAEWESRRSQYIAQEQSTREEPKPIEQIKEPPPPEEDDPDLAAAIAASLADMHIQPPPVSNRANHDYQAVRSNELSPVETENINLFAVLIERMSQSGHDIASDEQIGQLYTRSGALLPKVVKNLEDVNRKHALFVEMHMKLNRAVQLYDKLLEQRLTSFQHQQHSHHHHHPTQPHQTFQQYQTMTLPSSSNGMYPQAYVPPNRIGYPADLQSNASQFPLTASQNMNRGVNYDDPAGNSANYWTPSRSTTGYPLSGTPQQLPPDAQQHTAAPYQPSPDDKPLIDL
ncbi:hypothetical protein BCR43DRAFT_489928 [Syncephalastrum racemosum]|uniref:Vacuolar protein sorting-associated protein 27 n=1 Tax=Syncephalastrum racemosum TaxID=13706 RepID=A0A1X2HF30_SYNRA|nr:hypothetical protein BCR43DRAFT_489928 [Syncephalastrum racemosum]